MTNQGASMEQLAEEFEFLKRQYDDMEAVNILFLPLMSLLIVLLGLPVRKPPFDKILPQEETDD
jgi:hypothetical protein